MCREKQSDRDYSEKKFKTFTDKNSKPTESMYLSQHASMYFLYVSYNSDISEDSPLLKANI